MWRLGNNGGLRLTPERRDFLLQLEDTRRHRSQLCLHAQGALVRR
jgi:hypothetical protein